MGLEAAVAAVMAAFAAAAVAIRSRKKQALQVLWGVVHDPLLAWCLGCGCTCPSHQQGGHLPPLQGGHLLGMAVALAAGLGAAGGMGMAVAVAAAKGVVMVPPC